MHAGARHVELLVAGNMAAGPLPLQASNLDGDSTAGLFAFVLSWLLAVVAWLSNEALPLAPA